MIIPRKGPLWALVMFVPLTVISIVGCFVIVIGWDSMDRKLRKLYLELWEGK